MSTVDQAPPVVARGSWSNQSEEYGRSFADVYDTIFPRDDAALDAARFLAELARAVDGSPSACEFGVGTGRVALPLSRLGIRLVGVDSSTELLARVQESPDVVTAVGDIRSWRAPTPAAVSYCICATLSMVESTADQLSTLRGLADSTRAGGHVVVETHNPERVRRAHGGRQEVEFDVAVPGLAGRLRSWSTLSDDGIWHLRHHWGPGPADRAVEFSRLLEPDRLDELARIVGLVPQNRHSGWRGEVFDPLSPQYIAVFRVPADRSPDGSTEGDGEHGTTGHRTRHDQKSHDQKSHD